MGINAEEFIPRIRVSDSDIFSTGGVGELVLHHCLPGCQFRNPIYFRRYDQMRATYFIGRGEALHWAGPWDEEGVARNEILRVGGRGREICISEAKLLAFRGEFYVHECPQTGNAPKCCMAQRPGGQRWFVGGQVEHLSGGFSSREIAEDFRAKAERWREFLRAPKKR